MNPPLALDSSRHVRRGLVPVIVALGMLATSPVPGGAIVIDSFTDALPPNPLLTASGQPVLFIGQACDGAECPPASFVQHTNYGNGAQQDGLAGVFGGRRSTGVGSLLESWGGAPYVFENCLLRVDPSDGGRLVLAPFADHAYIQVGWGQASAGGLNLDLGADGGDRFEIVYSAPRAPTGELYFLGGVDANGNAAHSATFPIQTFSRAGTLSVPYLYIGGLSEFLDDVDLIFLMIHGQAPTTVPVNNGEIVINEVRTNGGAVPTTTESWGRLKATYRR
jgi:hypothetical protein